MLAQWACSSEG